MSPDPEPELAHDQRPVPVAAAQVDAPATGIISIDAYQTTNRDKPVDRLYTPHARDKPDDWHANFGYEPLDTLPDDVGLTAEQLEDLERCGWKYIATTSELRCARCNPHKEQPQTHCCLIRPARRHLDDPNLFMIRSCRNCAVRKLKCTAQRIVRADYKTRTFITVKLVKKASVVVPSRPKAGNDRESDGGNMASPAAVSTKRTANVTDNSAAIDASPTRTSMYDRMATAVAAVDKRKRVSALPKDDRRSRQSKRRKTTRSSSTHTSSPSPTPCPSLQSDSPSPSSSPTPSAIDVQQEPPREDVDRQDIDGVDEYELDTVPRTAFAEALHWPRFQLATEESVPDITYDFDPSASIIGAAAPTSFGRLFVDPDAGQPLQTGNRRTAGARAGTRRSAGTVTSHSAARNGPTTGGEHPMDALPDEWITACDTFATDNRLWKCVARDLYFEVLAFDLARNGKHAAARYVLRGRKPLLADGLRALLERLGSDSPIAVEDDDDEHTDRATDGLAMATRDVGNEGTPEDWLNGDVEPEGGPNEDLAPERSRTRASDPSHPGLSHEMNFHDHDDGTEAVAAATAAATEDEPGRARRTRSSRPTTIDSPVSTRRTRSARGAEVIPQTVGPARRTRSAK